MKSGWCASSTGVGTATTMKSASRERRGSVVTSSLRAASSSSRLDLAGGIDACRGRRRSSPRDRSKPIVRYFAELDRQRQADVAQADDGHGRVRGGGRVTRRHVRRDERCGRRILHLHNVDSVFSASARTADLASSLVRGSSVARAPLLSPVRASAVPRCKANLGIVGREVGRHAQQLGTACGIVAVHERHRERIEHVRVEWRQAIGALRVLARRRILRLVQNPCEVVEHHHVVRIDVEHLAVRRGRRLVVVVHLCELAGLHAQGRVLRMVLVPFAANASASAVFPAVCRKRNRRDATSGTGSLASACR